MQNFIFLKMKRTFIITLQLIFNSLLFISYAQNYVFESSVNGGAYPFKENDAAQPCISPQQYEILDKRCAENIKLIKTDTIHHKSSLSTALNWPLQVAPGFTDCNYYILTAYVDENTTTGAIRDYDCGTNTYDGHKGTDICIWPFPFYKMDHSQVQVIAAAPGTILDKDDGNFDRNCASNSLTANYVIIQHSDGSCALYWHMKSGSVTTKAIGQTVTAGEYLGAVGSSGSSTAPHLHFEVWSGTTSSTYIDPYYGSCNTLNSASWWASQKPHAEPAVIKVSVHTSNAVIPGCDTTETPNESTTYRMPFQGQGLPAGSVKFYIFIRDEIPGTTVNLSILNPGGSVFNSWTFNCNNSYNGSYWMWTKALPTIAGTYTYKATYNGLTCSQNFEMLNPSVINEPEDIRQIQIFPNPSDDLITISADEIENGVCSFSLKNILGQILLETSGTIENRTIKKIISLSELQNGIYFLIIDTGKTRWIKKIIKQNK